MKNKLALISLFAAAALTLSAAALAESGENPAPIAENLEITTYRGVSAGGTLKASAPNGDALVFEISTPPAKGTVELGDGGSFVYTPGKGKRGRDYFGYRAVDTDGNCSQEATVIIRIMKQKTGVSYADMDGKAEEFAALRLAESGIFVGERLGNSYVFSPDKPVTRGEFLSMCMNAAEIDPLSGAVTTGFYDDSETPVWAKPYITTALTRGIVSGFENEDGRAVFSPDEPVTAAQAAVMLDKSFGITDVVEVWSQAYDAVPAWAAQSVKNVSGCGLLPGGLSLESEILTRAEAAVMLSNAVSLAGAR